MACIDLIREATNMKEHDGGISIVKTARLDKFWRWNDIKKIK